MNIKKSIFLSLALLLPIVTFLFLKFFGKNEFAVEPLFQQEIQSKADCNGMEYKVPYTIPDSILSSLLVRTEDSFTVIVLRDSVVASQQEQSIQLTRVFKEFIRDPLGVVMVTSDTFSDSSKSEKAKLQVLHTDAAQFTMFRNCIFLMPPVNDALVVDNNGRIMGQYAMADREDTDRLILELKILLKKY